MLGAPKKAHPMLGIILNGNRMGNIILPLYTSVGCPTSQILCTALVSASLKGCRRIRQATEKGSPDDRGKEWLPCQGRPKRTPREKAVGNIIEVYKTMKAVDQMNRGWLFSKS